MVVLPVVWALLNGCSSAEDDFPYVQFNALNEALTICIGDDPACTPTPSLALQSTNGSTEVGTATVDPPSGPVGTVHQIEVDVLDAWQETVALVQVTVTGERGEQSWDLRQDSADHGNWLVEIESLGDPQESREDTATLLLWEWIDATTTTTTTTETP
jgi:hypothetical protein